MSSLIPLLDIADIVVSSSLTSKNEVTILIPEWLLKCGFALDSMLVFASKPWQ